eukprot:c15832_g1_i2.p2 GENE.c15832_g1_i2~~c15832_g1_i2.p2  ORF type:complete len:100 (+),score=14.71 c15832_g1_i2:246-545(+)
MVTVQPFVGGGSAPVGTDQGRKICEFYIEHCRKLEILNCHQVVMASTHPIQDVIEFTRDKSIDTVFIGARGHSERSRQTMIGSYARLICSKLQSVVLVR